MFAYWTNIYYIVEALAKVSANPFRGSSHSDRLVVAQPAKSRWTGCRPVQFPSVVSAGQSRTEKTFLAPVADSRPGDNYRDSFSDKSGKQTSLVIHRAFLNMHLPCRRTCQLNDFLARQQSFTWAYPC